MDRRNFLQKAGLAFLALPAAQKFKGQAFGSEMSETVNSETEAKDALNIPKISIETHFRSAGELEMFQKFASQIVASASPSFKKAVVSEPFRRLSDIEQFRLPKMDAAGVKIQVLSGGVGMQAIKDPSVALDFARTVNDGIHESIRKYPERFAGFAAIPTQDPKFAADELERSVKSLGFKGAMIFGHTNGSYLDEKKYFVLWETAESLGAPIYLHAMDPVPEIQKTYETHPELTGATWAWGVETATHALRIIGGGVFHAFPNATLILGHMGEGLPYLLGRLDEGYYHQGKPPENMRKPFSQYIRENILISTSGKYRPEALRCAISAMGIDRVLFASDYPFVSPLKSMQLVENTDLSRHEKEKIYYRNAERWLKL